MSVTVSGVMINPVGEPVVNAQITLTAVANSLTVLNTFSVTVRTDNTGAYRIQLEEGSYSITVAANGRSFVYGAVTLDNTTGPSTLNQLLKQQIMESELTPDVILYFRQIQQQVANDLATIKVLESSATDATESAAHYRDEAKQYAADLDTALAVAQGYRDESGVSAAAAAASAIHAFESESVVIANANAAALSEANTLQYRDEAQSAADEASTLAAEQTATKIKLAVKTDADRAEAAREGAETAQLAVDTQVGEVNRLHTEVRQLATAAAGNANSAAQSASESESSKNAAAQSEQSALAGAEAAGNSATAAAGDKTAAKGFRDEAEQFAARAKASAESIDVSALEQQINQKVSQTEFDEAIADKASNQDLTDGLAGKLDTTGGSLTGSLILAGDATDPKGAVTKQQLDKNGGDYLLSFRLHTNRARIPAGYGAGDGQILARAVWPDAWAAINSGEVPVVSDAVWLSDVSKRGCYSTGDGSTTFRTPDYNGIQPGSIKAPYFRGDGGLTDGDVQSSALPNIKGTMTGGNAPATASGVFSLSGASSINGGAGSSFTARFGDVDFSAARYNPIYKDEVNEVRTNAVVGCYIIRLAGSYLNTGSIDAAALAASISALSARVGVLEAKSQLFTIMYPEGTPSSPYSFPVNTRRVYVNPFLGRVVKCIPEVYVNGVWGAPGWIYYYSTALAGSFGTTANQTDTLANIVVVSGTVSLSAASNTSGSPHNSNTSPTTALPLRIKVFTIDGGA
ncbi:TPA: prophage tail fiber N-terminal domain-containing protein [Yersinia enterocolitica]|nr:prophage tail fiber N-terminal domain-containing protein [Yersinia enterocolitica]HDV7149690.1 prophage tail fiber N-terminal domain-containing protein [Yersinia enterocolitica]HEM6612847.1 prophage tail fiber N-terminal domain-containing protein [Yersinia enterocolitica]